MVGDIVISYLIHLLWNRVCPQWTVPEDSVRQPRGVWGCHGVPRDGLSGIQRPHDCLLGRVDRCVWISDNASVPRGHGGLALTETSVHGDRNNPHRVALRDVPINVCRSFRFFALLQGALIMLTQGRTVRAFGDVVHARNTVTTTHLFLYCVGSFSVDLTNVSSNQYMSKSPLLCHI